MPLFGERASPHHPMLHPHHKERAHDLFKRHIENPPHTLVTPDPAFHGWWKAVTRGDLGGFGYHAETDDIDTYIFIDTESYSPQNPLVTIKTLCGTPLSVRECSVLDVGSGLEFNHYYVPSETELVHVFDKDGPLFDPTVTQSSWSLKLQKDKMTICASSDSRPEYEGYGATSLLFKKANPPTIDKGAQSDTLPNPVEMAKYIREALLLHYNQSQNTHFHDKDYLPEVEANEIVNKLFSDGITFGTKIRKIRVSVPGEHVRQEFGDFSSRDLLTDIFTDNFPYATAGSTVKISGFKGKWRKLNGTYVNGVAIDEDGGIPNPSREHIDAAPSKRPRKGTFRNVYNHFLLRFDSSNRKKFPRSRLGWAKDVKGDPKITVTHRFSADMNYPAFFAAVRAMFFLLYKVSQHNGQAAYFKPGSMFLIDNWKELQDAMKSGNYWSSPQFPGNNLIGTRTSQKVPSGFYNNARFAERGVTTYNDPFRLSQKEGSLYDYNIVLANYITQPKNLYWAIHGTPMPPYQFAPQTTGYKPLIPGAEKAHFVGKLSPLIVTDGKPLPQNPDPFHYTIYGVGSGTEDMRDANSYYIGLINPKLTKGKKIGYLRWLDEDAQDPSLYIATSLFAPDVPVTPKYGREALTSLYANITRYFQKEHDCDAVIIDIRSYNGGYGFCYTLAELFGDDRESGPVFWAEKENLHAKPIDLTDPDKFSFFNNVASLDGLSTSRLFVRQNETNYGPDCVFRGSASRSKKIVILTDNAALSAGDAFAHYFLGERLDGDIGSNTHTVIIGDIDGRLKGAASYENPLPQALLGNYFQDAQGNPISPIYFRADFACGQEYNGKTGIPFNQQTNYIVPIFAPSLTGKAKGAPLINDWQQLVWRDVGLVRAPKGHFSRKIPLKKPKLNKPSTWRDSWLEQAVLEAMR